MAKREPVPPVPTAWGSGMQVRHRITGSTGVVVGVDFEEDLVSVMSGDYEVQWRIENTYEVRDA